MCFAKKLLFGECVLVSYLSWFCWYKLVHRKILYRHLTHTTHKNNVLRYTVWWMSWACILDECEFSKFEILNFMPMNQATYCISPKKSECLNWISAKIFRGHTSTSYTILFRNLQINNFYSCMNRVSAQHFCHTTQWLHIIH